ncbi:MAG: DUF3037 domain-containing protein [Bacteroidetes bacterium]|nr:DUF3037 domain-containing protein [Bacteroidota bacterium]
MPDRHVYEYAIIRLVPKVEREEFLNVGVIVFCKRKKYLRVKFYLDEARILAFSDELDLEEVQAYLKTWEYIANGQKEGGKIAQLDQPNRFRWLTNSRSTIIQPSKVHVGLCEAPEEVLEKLFSKYVK